MAKLDAVLRDLSSRPLTWLVTGAAGFIGSHLTEALLGGGQKVIGVDNFSTGSQENLDDVLSRVGKGATHFQFVEGDLCEPDLPGSVVDGVDIVLHQAALGSVPRSVADPLATHHANVTAFVNLVLAARDAGIRRLVYASSSSVYGDEPSLPKREKVVGRPLSPYAATKRANELYAHAFEGVFGMELVGLRYFNVFGPRQDPQGPYAAVVPRWIESLLQGNPCTVYGDGETSRDFCFVQNVVQANILAAVVPLTDDPNRVYNVACGRRATLNELFGQIASDVARFRPDASEQVPDYSDFRVGDVRHSEADIRTIAASLGYRPTHFLKEGIRQTVEWYATRSALRSS